jgi:hypothetical protein
MITVETTESAIRVTIPTNEVPPERVSDILEWLEFERVAGKSGLPEEEADRIAEEIKAKWWAANKARFIPAEER